MIKTSNELIKNEINDSNQSEKIDFEFFDLWDEHTNPLNQISQLLVFVHFDVT
jgi:hypothetical protein